jgi:hypothetical protein
MRELYFLTLAFLILSTTVQGQKEGLETINKNNLKAYMKFFASDEMKGRETGTAENEIASLYLRTNLMRIGLKPLPETGDYLQQVPLISSEIKSKETYLRINDNNGETVFTTDSLVYLTELDKTIELSGNFVFAGYGYEDTISGYNDLKDVDLKDKIVLIMTGSPQKNSSEGSNPVFDINLERPKLISIYNHGAKAILFVYEPGGKFNDAYASGLAEMGAGSAGVKIFSLTGQEYAPPVQVVFITQHAANMLLISSGCNLRQMKEKIIAGKRPVSFELKDITTTFRTYIEKNKLICNNVIGLVEGSDPVLKDECVIYTAHFDHIGVNQNGDAFNGADDNASGSMALLEVAQAFMNLKNKPLRTIVFAWVNGEEKGLLGSRFYASNPVVPLEKTLMDINLDMVGRSKMPSDTGKFMGFDVNLSQQGEILLYTDQKGNDILDLIKSTSKEAGIKTINMGKDPLIGSSDFASFMERGVPAIFFNSGEYPDLHTIWDDIEKIDFDKIESVSKMVFLIGYDIANQKKRFVPVTIN